MWFWQGWQWQYHSLLTEWSEKKKSVSFKLATLGLLQIFNYLSHLPQHHLIKEAPLYRMKEQDRYTQMWKGFRDEWKGLVVGRTWRCRKRKLQNRNTFWHHSNLWIEANWNRPASSPLIFWSIWVNNSSFLLKFPWVVFLSLAHKRICWKKKKRILLNRRLSIYLVTEYLQAQYKLWIKIYKVL